MSSDKEIILDFAGFLTQKADERGYRWLRKFIDRQVQIYLNGEVNDKWTLLEK